MLKEIPEDITLCTLDCIVMPNGEIISGGKSLGWMNDKYNLNKFLTPIKKEESNEQVRS